MEYHYFGNFGEERNVNIAEEHRRRVINRVNTRFWLRDYTDPFDISVPAFKKLYRLPQHAAIELVNIIAPYVPVRTSPKHIPLELKVLSALHFYGHGSYQEGIGNIANGYISQKSVSNFVQEITEALNHPDLLLRFIHFPDTPDVREAVIERNTRLGLPRVLGFIDGTLVKIVPPPRAEDGHMYYSRKGYTAINAQIVCDADLYIMDVNAMFPGSCNDPHIYTQSGMRTIMRETYRETRCWLLGDSIYPLEPWLQTPIPDAEPGTPEYDFSKVHCHCRNPVERCNGMLKGRWRCMLHDRTLHYGPMKAGLLINACSVLHNFCVLRNLRDEHLYVHIRDDDLLNNEDLDGLLADDLDDDGNAALRQEAGHVRQFLIDYVAARRPPE